MCKKLVVSLSNPLIYLVSFVLVLGLANNAFAEIPRDPNLVLYYSFEDVGKIVPDESGKGHHGAVFGDVSKVPSGIKYYGAAKFEGRRGPTGYSYLDLNGPGFPDQDKPKSAITLAVWVKCQNTGDHHATLSTRSSPAANNTWIIHAEIRSGGNFRWLLRAYNPSTNTTTTIFDMQAGTVKWDEWLHYTGTYDKTTGKAILYIDGQVIREQNITNPPNIATEWGAGARLGYNIDNARPFTGIMDEFYLFTRALSQAEINDLLLSEGLPSEKASHPNPGNGSELQTTSAVLEWLPGVYAASHDVYFGTVEAAVTNGDPGTFKVNQTASTFDPGPLQMGTTYYWRIDEVNNLNPASPWKGDTWSFSIVPLTAWKPNPPDGAKFIDPNADLSWSPGSGAVNHYVYFGDNFDTVNNAAGAPPQTQTTYDPGTLGFDKVYYWRVDESNGSVTHKGNVWHFTTMRSGSGIKGQYYKDRELQTLVLTRVDPGINFNWGSAAPHPTVPADNFSVRWTGELEVPFTSAWTFTTNCDDGVRLWVNDELIINGWGQQSGVEWTGTINLTEGQRYSIIMEYYEITGDARAILYWNSPYWLSPYQPKQIIPQGAFSPPLRAGNPKPANGATDVKDTTTLSWVKGDTADKHDVYFGTDQAAVEGATTATAGIYRGRQALDATTYTPAEAPLEWGKIYYWRIDEVEADGVTIHKGNLWSFTVGEFLAVDDMESYNAQNSIWYTWKDGYGYTEPAPGDHGNGSGSMVDTDSSIKHGDANSLKCMYDNTGTFKNIFGETVPAYYSEVIRTFDTPQDWTSHGVKTLTVWFRGSASNTAARLYVAVEDIASNAVVVANDNPNAALLTDWTEWNVSLQNFSGVNLTSVRKLTLRVGDKNSTQAGGTGTVYFDDIRLYPPPPPPAPPGGWTYTYAGDAAVSGPANSFDSLDGTWDHNNGSDSWDGSALGAGMPGGVSALDGFLRLQDPGDPRDYAMPDPSNRKVYFGHSITNEIGAAVDAILDTGATVSFRARVATEPPLDNLHPDGGAGIAAWPAGGDGYLGHDGGKGSFGIRQLTGDKIISFSLALASDSAFLAGKNGLVLNSLNGTSPSGSVDAVQSEGTLNILELDPTVWHEFWITIEADVSATGTHLVKVYLDGSSVSNDFIVTAGNGNDYNDSYIAMGLGSTAQSGSIDIDYFSYKPGVFAPGQ